MAIRKEQALLLVTIAFAYWMYSGLKTVKKTRARSPKQLEYTAQGALEPMNVTAKGPVSIRELFREPSESRPLPPRDDLPFPGIRALDPKAGPDERPLPVVLLPLPTGQQPAAFHGLRHAPLPKAEVGQGGGNPGAGNAGAGNAGAGAAGAGNPGAGNGGNPRIASPAAMQDDPTRLYDTLYRIDGNTTSRFYGLFLGSDAEKFALASKKGPYAEGITVRFQWINEKTGKRINILKPKGSQVAELKLAKTLRNEVGMRLHQFKPTQSNFLKQREFILWLLEKAKLESWVYEKAMERAKIYTQFAKPREDGLYYTALVHRAMGDLPGEYKLFRDLDNDKELKGSSFQLRGLGVVESKLRLDKLAEKHLTEAVRKSEPLDPRNYVELAKFFLDRGRAREAVAPAEKAVEHKIMRDPTEAERVGFDLVLVRAKLAVGDLDGAAAGVSRGVGADLQYLVDYQTACVAYGKQDFATAEPLFQQVYNTGLLPEALLGLAATQLAAGKGKDAKGNFDKLIDEQPRLRHLGLAGLGLMLSNGNGQEALEKIDAAIVAFPNHPYLLYLQGRQRRLNGDLDGAVEPLRTALRLHDDFLEALAELTATYYALFKRNNDVEALLSAVRYVDRLAKLDMANGAQADLFLEMQGKIHYEARDLAGAKAAFGTKGEDASVFCKIGLAMIEYAQKRQGLAERRILDLTRDLPSNDALRKHAEFLLQLMLRHGNKEQVIDIFDRAELGKAWQGGKESGAARPTLDRDSGELRIKGEFGRRPGQWVNVPRFMSGPGRFLTLSTEMKVNPTNESTFAGVQLAIPNRGGGSTRFSLRIGIDDRRKLIVQIKDGRESKPPIQTGITVNPGDWHRLVVSVDDPDDHNPKDQNRYLKVLFDGKNLIPEKDRKLKGLRRSDTKANQFLTEYRVEARQLAKVDVAFRKYHRIQERKK